MIGPVAVGVILASHPGICGGRPKICTPCCKMPALKGLMCWSATLSAGCTCGPSPINTRMMWPAWCWLTRSIPRILNAIRKKKSKKKTYSQITAFFPALARIGLFRLYFASGGEIDFPDLPAQQHAEVAALWSSPAYFQNSRAEGQMGSAIREQGQELSDLGDIPLVVISAGIHPANWTALQAELPSLSTNSRHITVDEATHGSLAFNPDHAKQTSAAILQVVEAANTGGNLEE
jgi:hypothetical protein